MGLSAGYNHNWKWRYLLNTYIDQGKNTMGDDRVASRFTVEAMVSMSL